MNTKLLIYLLLLGTNITASSKDYVKDGEPAILEKLCGLPGLILMAQDANGDYIFEADGLTQNPGTEVGIFTYDDKRGYTTVTRDKFFNNWWKYKNSNFAAKIQAAFGVGEDIPTEKPKPVMYDKEERNYPHNL